MKPAYAFWLTLVALLFIAVQSLVSLPGALVQFVEVALGIIAICASFPNAMSNRHRVLLFTIGLGLVLPNLVTWAQPVGPL